MNVQLFHPWEISAKQAKKVQKELSGKIQIEESSIQVQKICGVDVGFGHDTSTSIATAACVVLSFPDLKLIEYRTEKHTITFPYIHGLLSFREIPPLIAVLERLKIEPDLIIADGQGIAHPRRFGLACHLGLIFNKPSIGCAKSRLIGEYERPGGNRGDYTYLSQKGEIIGAVVRTRKDVKPVFVSPGHLISLASSVRFILQTCRGYRLPEPVRYAHRAASGRMLVYPF